MVYRTCSVDGRFVLEAVLFVLLERGTGRAALAEAFERKAI